MATQAKKPAKKRPTYGNPDILEFNKRLYRSVAGRYYSDVMRHQEFKAVFDTPAGKRVLFQLFMWSGMYATDEVVVKETNDLWKREGARELCHRIMAILNAEISE